MLPLMAIRINAAGKALPEDVQVKIPAPPAPTVRNASIAIAEVVVALVRKGRPELL